MNYHPVHIHHLTSNGFGHAGVPEVDLTLYVSAESMREIDRARAILTMYQDLMQYLPLHQTPAGLYHVRVGGAPLDSDKFQAAVWGRVYMHNCEYVVRLRKRRGCRIAEYRGSVWVSELAGRFAAAVGTTTTTENSHG